MCDSAPDAFVPAGSTEVRDKTVTIQGFRVTYADQAEPVVRVEEMEVRLEQWRPEAPMALGLDARTLVRNWKTIRVLDASVESEFSPAAFRCFKDIYYQYAAFGREVRAAIAPANRVPTPAERAEFLELAGSLGLFPGRAAQLEAELAPEAVVAIPAPIATPAMAISTKK